MSYQFPTIFSSLLYKRFRLCWSSTSQPTKNLNLVHIKTIRLRIPAQDKCKLITTRSYIPAVLNQRGKSQWTHRSVPSIIYLGIQVCYSNVKFLFRSLPLHFYNIKSSNQIMKFIVNKFCFRMFVTLTLMIVNHL